MEDQANAFATSLQADSVPQSSMHVDVGPASAIPEQTAEITQDTAMDEDPTAPSEAAEDEEEEDNWADLTEDETPGTRTSKRPVMECLNLVFYYDAAEDTLCRLCE